MSDDRPIDPQTTYKITEAARLLSVSPSTLRTLEQRGAIASTRSPGGHRSFSGTELLRFRAESQRASSPTPPPSASRASAPAEDSQARHDWFGQWIVRAQRALPADTAAEVRLRLSHELEHALRHWGPACSPDDVDILVTSVVERARRQAQQAEADAARREARSQLIDDALVHLQERIDRLPTRMLGPVRSLKRVQTTARLRDKLRQHLQTRLRGDEDSDEIQDIADAFLARWVEEQGPHSRVPNTLKVIAVGATGVVGGVATAAAFSPGIRAQVAKLTALLRSRADEALRRLRPSPPPESSPPNPPDQTIPTSPPFRPGVGVGAGWPPSYGRPSKYARWLARRSRSATPRSVTASGGPALELSPTNSDAVPPEPSGAPDPAS